MLSRNQDRQSCRKVGEYESNVGLYIHIPFCRKRCLYCDFVTAAGQEQLIPAYVDALEKEIEGISCGVPGEVKIVSVYFGGGTPSLLPAESVHRLMRHILSNFNVQRDAEVTLEVNPGTVKPDYFAQIRNSGVNRLSIGMQSGIDSELIRLGRIHTFDEFLHTVTEVKKVGFQNFSFDLIYGIPGQTLESWERSLGKAVELEPSHLSLYSLTIEEDTPFGRMLAHGQIQMPDDDLMADMYELATDFLAARGFQQYEISNWARPSPNGALMSSRHNLQYWRNLPYLGFGAGAHGSLGGFRLANVKGTQGYIEKSKMQEFPLFPKSFATEELLEITDYERMQETMMLGLRLTAEGVGEAEFCKRYGLALKEIFGKEVEKLILQGLLEKAGDQRGTIRLTRRGRMLGNQVFLQFVGD